MTPPRTPPPVFVHPCPLRRYHPEVRPATNSKTEFHNQTTPSTMGYMMSSALDNLYSRRQATQAGQPYFTPGISLTANMPTPGTPRGPAPDCPQTDQSFVRPHLTLFFSCPNR